MQHKPAISKVFQAKGYMADTIITFSEFQTVMDLLTTDNISANQSARSLAREIWKETEMNKLQTIQVKQDQIYYLIPSIKITTDYLISYIVDAIEILTNRTQQCRKTIADLKYKQKEFQQKKDYPKLEVLQHKLTTLVKDNIQFQNDLKVLTQTFLNESHRLTLIEEKYPRKPAVPQQNIRKESLQRMEKQVQQKKKKEQQQKMKLTYPELQQYLKESKGEPLEIQMVEDQKKLCLWFLGLLVFFETTVMIVKFCFVNLMVFLLGFFVLLEPFRQNMVKIAYFSCLYTLPFDFLWLLVNSGNYISPEANTGLAHIIKPYSQYIWFVTILQTFIKFIFLWVLKKYQHLEIVMSQQLQREEEVIEIKQRERVTKKYVDDHYLPNLKEFAKIQSSMEKDEGS